VRNIEASGSVRDLSGSCPNVTFVVDGLTVTASAGTNFRGGCESLRNGVEVDVEGTLMSDGTVRAERIEIDD
jgi:hypothetical protein